MVHYNVDPGYLGNGKEAGGGGHKALRAQVRTVQERESVSPLSRLIKGFCNKFIDPPWEDQCEWQRMTRMTGPDCAVMCNLLNTHTHTRSLLNTHTHTHTVAFDQRFS